jgi:hypothetical protein
MELCGERSLQCDHSHNVSEERESLLGRSPGGFLKRLQSKVALSAALTLTFAMLFLAAGYSLMSISINIGRVNDLSNIEAQIRQKANEIAIGSAASETLQQELLSLSQRKQNTVYQMQHGNGTPLSFVQCILPLDPNCFHRNSNETNNIWLAIASGVLGVCLVLMRGFRLGAAARQGQLAADTSSILSVVCMFPTGMIFGLLTLYLLRGTRGTLLAPISDVVQVEDPYGVAFACTIAALFSDRIILWLTKLVNFLPNEGSNGREGSGH